MIDIKQYLCNERPSEKTISVDEGISDQKLWKAIDKLKEILGAEELVDQICQAMSDDDLKDTLEFIIRMNDLKSEIKI
jgi:hypothetical protein